MIKEQDVKNNLFYYATKELSQDAFICWLISHAAKENESLDSVLTECARAMLQSFTKKHGSNGTGNLLVTKIRRQDVVNKGNVDILISAQDDRGEEHIIIVEDKTFTSAHNNQIEKYYTDRMKELSASGHQNTTIHCVYYKIIEQAWAEHSDVIEVVNIDRKEILRLMDQYVNETTNDIFVNYYQYLSYLDECVESYKNLEIKAWTGPNDHAYKGFFRDLIETKTVTNPQGTIQEYMGWGYVPNQKGGFNGFWWHFLNPDTLKKANLDDELEELYLQIENQKLVVKIKTKVDDASISRKALLNFFESKAEGFVGQKRYTKGPGKHITVGYLNYNYSNYKEKIAQMEKLMLSIGQGGLKRL